MITTIRDAFKYFMPFLILICLFFIVRSNNLSNPRIVRPKHYSVETYFPTPSVAVLDYYDNDSIIYYCANHKISKYNEDWYENKKFEQPCEECLSEDYKDSRYDYENNKCSHVGSNHEVYKYDGWEWVFLNCHHYTYGQPELTKIAPPINWKNPLTKIKNFDKLQLPYSHGFMIDSISLKEVIKIGQFKEVTMWENVSYPKNPNTINYLKEWYYKVPDYDVSKLETPLGKIFGINCKFEDY